MKEPLRILIRDGREGIGLEAERQRRLREAAEAASQQAKRARVDETTYRDRMRLERETARLCRLTEAAQKIAERMHGDAHRSRDVSQAATGESSTGSGSGMREGTGGRSGMHTASKGETKPSSPSLKALPVEFRGLVRARERAERERRMRHDLESGVLPILTPGTIPAYDDDDELDRDDRVALGRDEGRPGGFGADKEPDESDAELDEFESLEPGERLQRVVRYLRTRHQYCFWCKAGYPDELMDGCPGETEDDHD